VAEEISIGDFAKAVAQSPEDVRLKLANQLKKAGLYRGNVSSKFNNSLYEAIIAAEEKRVQLAMVVGPIDRFSFIDDLASEGSGGTGKPSRTTSRTISVPEALFDDVDAVTREYLGRELPDAAKKKLAEKYIAKQKAGKLDITTSYNADGTFSQTTGGGMGPQQFFIEEISQRDEAKANKALRGYEIINEMLGGLR
jgi:hypothetical protein